MAVANYNRFSEITLDGVTEPLASYRVWFPDRGFAADVRIRVGFPNDITSAYKKCVLHLPDYDVEVDDVLVQFEGFVFNETIWRDMWNCEAGHRQR